MPETPALVAFHLHALLVVRSLDLNDQHEVARWLALYFDAASGLWLRRCSPEDYHAALIAADELHAPRERAVGEELRG